MAGLASKGRNTKGADAPLDAARGQVMGCEGVMAQAGLEKEKHLRFRKCLIINVEVVGLESNLHPLADTLVLMLSIAYFCRRSCSTMSEIGILLGYYHGSRGV